MFMFIKTLDPKI